MDLAAVRADLATVARQAQFPNAWSIAPDDVGDLPAAVIAGISSLQRLTMSGVCKFTLDVDLYVNAADPVDAAARLDLALSLGLADSFLTALEAVTSADNPSWRSVLFLNAGPYQHVSMGPEGGMALRVTISLELTA